MKKIAIICLIALLGITAFSGCTTSKTITFAEAGWDSLRFHNAIAGFIAQTAFGYAEWSEIPGTTPVLHEGMIKGEVDVHMEVWTDNIASYKADIAEGKLTELGINFDDNYQGIYVPRYVIEGDPSRGIAPMAPDLKTVEDLLKYKDVFKDDEQPGKGRLYGAIPGWVVDEIMYNKYMYYGMDKDFVYFRPGSQAAMDAAFSTAYEKGEAIAGYYWEPTWLMGKYDFVLLEDAPYDPDRHFNGETAFPSVVVTICVSNDFAKKDPEFTEFLKKYRTSSALTSEALAYMQDTGANTLETAKWFLREHDELLSSWLTAEQAEAVRKELK
jgi:glycine betaine/proline transport system substrate-binding protein